MPDYRIRFVATEDKCDYIVEASHYIIKAVLLFVMSDENNRASLVVPF